MQAAEKASPVPEQSRLRHVCYNPGGWFAFWRRQMEALEKLRPLALLLLRAALGVIFIYHGYPKLFVNSHGRCRDSYIWDSLRTLR
jgi:hypothetical protein